MKTLTIALLALVFLTFHARVQQYEKKIDALIQKAIRLNRFNGSVLVTKNGKVIYEKAFGYQDAEKKILNNTNTIYQIGSTTKEFTAAVILKLAESNHYRLTISDDDIRISFKNENGSTVKIIIIEGLSTKRGDKIKL